MSDEVVIEISGNFALAHHALPPRTFMYRLLLNPFAKILQGSRQHHNRIDIVQSTLTIFNFFSAVLKQEQNTSHQLFLWLVLPIIPMHLSTYKSMSSCCINLNNSSAWKDKYSTRSCCWLNNTHRYKQALTECEAFINASLSFYFNTFITFFSLCTQKCIQLRILVHIKLTRWR